MSLVLDAGPIVALLDFSEPKHDACRQLVADAREDLVVPVLVLVEVDYWLHKRYGSEPWSVFVEDVERGAYRLHALDEAGLLRAAELERQYADLDLGLVDASVIVTCEQLGETKVATFDRRDFQAVRPAHCAALTLLPA